MRVPRVKHVDVAIAGLGQGLDGVRVAMITDTHYGPIDRARWSAAVVARVNALNPDVVCHVGDIADGPVDVREPQASPLASVNATSARVYVTGNH
jgi:predicted MPP superfamily phosphohydrolase